MFFVFKKMVLGLVVLVVVGFVGFKVMYWYNKGCFIEFIDNVYI